MGNIQFTASIDDVEFNKVINNIEGKIRGLRVETAKGTPFFTAADIADGYAAYQALKDIASGIVKVRVEIQQLELSFATLLKSKSDANALMAEITKMAATSPFEMKDIAEASKQLIIYGSNAKTVLDEIKMLGDVAVGTAVPISQLAASYAQMKANGTVSLDDLQKLAGSGIPIFEELAVTIGRNKQEVREFASAGRISFDEVETAFRQMTSSTGMFHGLMEQQSQTLQGALNKLDNAFSSLFNEMLQKNEGFVISTISGAAKVIENYDLIAGILKTVVALYGAYKAEMMVVSAFQAGKAALTLAGNAKAWFELTGSVKNAKDAMTLFSMASKATLIGVVLGAIYLVTKAFEAFKTEVIEVKTATELLSEADKELNVELSKQKNEVEALVLVLKNQNLMDSVRLEAYEKLKAISPDILRGLDFQTAKTADLTESVNQYLIALERKIALEANSKKLQEAVEKETELKSKAMATKKEHDDLPQPIRSGNVVIDFHGKERRKLKENLEREMEAHANSMLALSEVRQRFGQKLTESGDETIKNRIKELEEFKSRVDKNNPARKIYEDEIKKNVELLDSLSKSKINASKSFAERLAEANDYGNLLLLKSVKKTAKEFDQYLNKIESLKKKHKKGTEEYQNLVNLSNESIKTHGVTVTNKPQIKPTVRAQEKPTIDQTLQEKKKLYEEYNKWVWAKGKEWADKEYEGLLKAGKNYSEYLNGEIAILEGKVDNNSATAQDKASLLKMKEESMAVFRSEVEEKKKQYEEYNKWVWAKGKEWADKEYEGLLKAGKNYGEYLNGEIAILEGKVDNNSATAQDKASLLKMKEESMAVFRNEIEEKKKQYELYNRWVQYQGKESANKQFSGLIDASASYQDYLKGEINKLESALKTGVAIPEQKEKLIELKARIVVDTEELENFKKRLEESLGGVSTATEQLELLYNERDSLKGSDDKSKQLIVEQQILDLEQKRLKLLKEFLPQAIEPEKKRLEIQKKYADMRAAVEKEYGEEKGKVYEDAMATIEKAQKQEVNEFNVSLAKKTKEFMAFTKTIEDATKGQTLVVLKAEREKLKAIKAAGGEATKEYKDQLAVIKASEKKHLEESLKNWSSIASTIGSLGATMSNVGGSVGEVGDMLSGLGSGMSSVLKTISSANEGGSLGIEGYASILQNVLGMIDAIMAANERRKKQEKQFKADSLAYNKQVTIAGIKKEGAAHKENGNMFMTDTQAKIQAGAKQYQAAQEKYQEAISNLGAGKAKIRQDNVVDGKTVGQLAGKGAGIGATIGVAVGGPIGAAIGAGVGALVGGIVGLFSKKKKDVFGGLLDQYKDLVVTGENGWKSINVEMAQALIANNQLDEETKQLVQTAIDYNDTLAASTAQMEEGILELTGKLGDSIRDSLIGAFKSGESAADAFGKAVGNVVADIASKLLFTAMFKDGFDKLEKEMKESYSVDGDQSIVDDLARYMAENKDKPQQYAEGLKELNTTLETMGFTDAMGAGGNDGKSMSGSIKSITEETAGVLAGQINAIRITQASSLEVNRNQLIALTEIATNSRFLKHLERLETIEKKLTNDNANWRAVGH